MEHYIPQIIAGFAASGGSIWLRNKIARGVFKRAYDTHDKGNMRLKKDLAQDTIEYRRGMDEISGKLDKAESIPEMDSIMLEAKTLDGYHGNQLKRHQKASDYYGSLIDKLNKDLRFIKYNIPLFLSIASLGLAGYESIAGRPDIAMASIAFAIPHLVEVAANQLTGIKIKT